MTITATQSPTAGQAYTLNCFARTEDYVISAPRLEWLNVDVTDNSITQSTQINGTISANRSLSFNPIRTSHGRNYTCRASVNIPLANITDRRNTASQRVRVLSKLIILVMNS